MRYALLLAALAMPVVAWLSVRGALGPDPSTLSAQYPTLVVAAGYAFSIWSLIFVLDLAYATWQVLRHGQNPRADRVAPVLAIGFGLTSLWMPVFAQQWFVLALAVIWGALGCLLYSAVRLSRAYGTRRISWAAALHAGWLSLAAFLNTAQVIVAENWLSARVQLPWSLLLMIAALALLAIANARMRGHWGYVGAAVWGLVAVFVEQRASTMDGANVTAWLALAMATIVLAQTLWLRMRGREQTASAAASH